MSDDIRKDLQALFDAGVSAANPRGTLAAHLPARTTRRCVVIGAGSASALTALALEEAWPEVALTGIVVTRVGYTVPTVRIEILKAARPVPDAAIEKTAERTNP